MTTAAAPVPAARARAKTNGVSTCTLGPRPSRLSGIDRNGGDQHDQGQHGPLGQAVTDPVEVDARREQGEHHEADRRDDGNVRPEPAHHRASLPPGPVWRQAADIGPRPHGPWHDASRHGHDEEGRVAESEGPASGRPNRRRLVVRALLAVAVIAAVYLGVLPRLVDVSQVWATLRAMTWLELATLVLAAVWNLLSYLLPQLAAMPGLSLRQAALESHASTAVGNLLPAGQAVGLGVTYRFYTSYGFGSGPIALSLLVQGVWNNLIKLGMPIMALGLLVASGDAGGELAPAALVGLVVF